MNMNNMVFGQVGAVFDSRGPRPERIRSRNIAESHRTLHSQVCCRPVTARLFRALIGLMSVLMLALSPSGAAYASSVTDLLNDGLQSHLAGDLRRAVEVYTEVVNKDSQNATAYNWRGTAYDDLGDLDKALADLTKAVEIDDKYADAYNNRGEVFRKMGKPNEAIKDYQKASTLDPAFAEAHYNMALVYEGLRNNPQAAQQYKKYVELKPDAKDKAQVEQTIAKLGGAPADAGPPTRTATARPRPGPPQQPGPEKAPAVGAMTPGPPTPAPPSTATPPQPKPGDRPGARPGDRPGVKPGERPGARPGGAPGAMAARPGAAPVATVAKVPSPFDQWGLTPELYLENKEAFDTFKQWYDLAMEWAWVAFIAGVVLYIFNSLFLFLIARKTGTGAAVLAFLPILDVYLQYRIADKPLWWFLLSIPLSILVVPVLIMYFIVCLGIARARGKSGAWAVLLWLPILLPPLLPTRTLALAYLGLTR
ncbi:MAG: tetratricopeptide repeat protein [Thermodesulfobacteriota bacterium]